MFFPKFHAGCFFLNFMLVSGFELLFQLSATLDTFLFLVLGQVVQISLRSCLTTAPISPLNKTVAGHVWNHYHDTCTCI